MKKLTAILLSVLMLLTMLPMGGLAVAADEVRETPYIEEGVTTSVKTNLYGTSFKFVPAETGYYSFYSGNSNGEVGGRIYDADGKSIASASDVWDFSIVCMLTAGVTYELEVYGSNEGYTRCNVCVQRNLSKQVANIEFEDVRALAMDLENGIPRMATVYYSDGTSQTVTGSYIYIDENDDFGSYVQCESEISHYNWTAGNTYTVDASVRVRGVLFRDQYTVTVEETPVASVEVAPMKLIENGNGYATYNKYWNEELGQYEEKHFFSYYDTIPSADKITITLKDGTVINDTSFKWNGRTYSLTVQPQYYNTRLQLGTNERTLYIADYEGTYTIDVVETPVASVEIKNNVIIENSNGYWRTESVWNEELNRYEEKSYFRYHVFPESYSNSDVVITLKDGTVHTGGYLEIDGISYQVQGTRQNYENRLQMGINERTLSVAGYTGIYTMEIIDTPVASVEIQPIQVIENDDGYWDTDSVWNEELGQYESKEYFYYYGITPGNNGTTITLKDGTVIQGKYFEWNGNQYSINTDGQGYESRLLPGVNERAFSIAGYEGTYTVEVVDTPVASVEMPAITLIENCGGEWNTASIWDEEQGTYVEREYYYYDSITPSYNDIIITLKDGTVINSGEFYWNGNWYYMDYESQYYENRLLPGVNERPFTIAGYEGTYTVTVSESPVSAITADVVDCKQYTDGEWETGWVYDEESGGYQSTPYFHYNILPSSLTFTLKDGTTKTVNVVESEDWDHDYDVIFNGQRYELDIQDPQYADTPWDIGTYNVSGNVLGVDFTYQVVVGPRDTDAIFDYVDADGGVIITDCFVPAETIEIPATIDGKPVIGVADLGDANWVIQNLIFSDSVTMIGEYVLTNHLSTVHFGAGISNLHEDMFNNCYFWEITVSPNNPHYAMVGDGLHDKAVTTLIAHTSSGEYTVPATVYDIGALAKEVYDNVRLVIPEGHAHVTKVEGVTYDKDMTRVMFCDEEKTGKYVMPESVTEVASYAFLNSQLTDVVVSPKVTELVYCVFASCASLESVTLPEGLISINQQVFRGTDSLKVVELPDTLTRISYEAFDYSGLTTLYLPKSVTEILDYAFSGCWNLTDVYYTGSEEDRAAIEMGYNWRLEEATWHYNTCSKNAHIYDNECDNTCNNCAWIRSDAPGHSYIDGCDPDCDSCGFPRTPPHDYDGPCDGDCSGCGVTREPPHEYSGFYDTDCDLCGQIREVPDIVLGDATGDGKVNIRDLGVLQQKLNGWDVSISMDAMDLTGDGKVNIRDLGLLQQYLNGWDVKLGG